MRQPVQFADLLVTGRLRLFAPGRNLGNHLCSVFIFDRIAGCSARPPAKDHTKEEFVGAADAVTEFVRVVEVWEIAAGEAGIGVDER